MAKGREGLGAAAPGDRSGPGNRSAGSALLALLAVKGVLGRRRRSRRLPRPVPWPPWRGRCTARPNAPGARWSADLACGPAWAAVLAALGCCAGRRWPGPAGAAWCCCAPWGAEDWAACWAERAANGPGSAPGGSEGVLCILPKFHDGPVFPSRREGGSAAGTGRGGAGKYGAPPSLCLQDIGPVRRTGERRGDPCCIS
jgi:hypothetical protein